MVQANRTSRDVPNSITVLSGIAIAGVTLPGSIPCGATLPVKPTAPTFWLSLAGLLRVNCTGIRTGVASGKKRARSATVLASLARPFAVPLCPKRWCSLLKIQSHSDYSSRSDRSRRTCYTLRQNSQVRLGSPSSRLGRALGSQNTRLCHNQVHDRDHYKERKD